MRRECGWNLKIAGRELLSELLSAMPHGALDVKASSKIDYKLLCGLEEPLMHIRGSLERDIV